MNIQIQLNGKIYPGLAYNAGNDLLIHLPTITAPPEALPFEQLFGSVPPHRSGAILVEIGRWNVSKYKVVFEDQVSLWVGPDGAVWAKVCSSPDDLPLAEGVDIEQYALGMLAEAEDAFDAKSTAEERAANGGWPLPVTVSDYLFWVEDEAEIQEACHADPGYVRTLHSFANELRKLGFSPAPAPWN